MACKKETTAKPKYNIVYKELYNQPLDTIRYYLNGKWQVQSIYGGFLGGLVEYPKNTFIEFKFAGNIVNDSIKHYNDTTIFANSKADWSFKYDIFGDSTYLLQYLDNFVFYQKKVIQQIINDTLEIRDNYINGYAFECTKVN